MRSTKLTETPQQDSEYDERVALCDCTRILISLEWTSRPHRFDALLLRFEG